MAAHFSRSIEAAARADAVSAARSEPGLSLVIL